MLTWVIGAGGLFGSAITRHSSDVFCGEPISWNYPDKALVELQSNLRRLRTEMADEWCIAWAAGLATTSSSDDETRSELELFKAFITLLGESRLSGRGVFLLISSAGGAYAGSHGAPFDEHTKPVPLSPYGRLKLDQEKFASTLTQSGISVVITRVSNLYGPGQNLAKLQGLVSRLAVASITRNPITMFVPLDTLRDYIHVDDAAVRVLHWAHEGLLSDATHPLVRIVASGESASIGRVIALVQGVSRTRIPIASGMHASSAAQAHDLRLEPSHDAATQRLSLTPFPAGIKEVYQDILSRYQTRQMSQVQTTG